MLAFLSMSTESTESPSTAEPTTNISPISTTTTTDPDPGEVSSNVNSQLPPSSGEPSETPDRTKSTSQSSSSGDALSLAIIGAVIGGVVAVLVIAALVILVIVLMRRRRQQRKVVLSNGSAQDGNHTLNNPTYSGKLKVVHVCNPEIEWCTLVTHIIIGDAIVTSMTEPSLDNPVYSGK